MRRLMLAAILGVLAAGRAEAGYVITDDFNRADSSTLGPGWTTRNPGLGIVGGQAATTRDEALSTYNGPSQSAVEIDVFTNQGRGVQYAAIVLKYTDVGNNIFIKVQSQGSSPSFGNYAIYYGNDGLFSPAGIFGTLETPFTSGKIRATLTGDTATLQVDPGFTGTFTQSYSYTFSALQVAALGSGVGIGAYGGASIDNFAIGTPDAIATPEPASLASTASGLVALGLYGYRRSRRKAA